jgi:GntR family transcriptional repressor for pyruvate dehydrogenase complex
MQTLIGEIVGGQHAEGERLPREVDLAERFGVSRGVARECIRALEERGLVSVKHGRGATVNPSTRWDIFDPDVLAALLTGPAGGEILAESIECRRILEVEAAGLAAERASAEDLRALADAFTRMAENAARAGASPGAEDRFDAADVDFHRALVGATGNRALGRMTEPVHAAIARARRVLAPSPGRLDADLADYQRIMAAVAGRDPGAARAAMRAHLDRAAAQLRARPPRRRRRRAAPSRR